MKFIRKEHVTNNAGNSLVELVMVMMLLILFGTTIYTLIYTGSETQAKIIRQKNAQIEARIAMSYLNVRLKQNDADGKISIRPNAVNGQNAIVIRDLSHDRELDTWIYWSDGMLKEALYYPEETIRDEPGMYTPIAEISGFQTRLNPDGTVTNTILYESDDKTQTLETETYLKIRPDNGTEVADVTITEK